MCHCWSCSLPPKCMQMQRTAPPVYTPLLQPPPPGTRTCARIHPQPHPTPNPNSADRPAAWRSHRWPADTWRPGGGKQMDKSDYQTSANMGMAGATPQRRVEGDIPLRTYLASHTPLHPPTHISTYLSSWEQSVTYLPNSCGAGIPKPMHRSEGAARDDSRSGSRAGSRAGSPQGRATPCWRFSLVCSRIYSLCCFCKPLRCVMRAPPEPRRPALATLRPWSSISVSRAPSECSAHSALCMLPPCLLWLCLAL